MLYALLVLLLMEVVHAVHPVHHQAEIEDNEFAEFEEFDEEEFPSGPDVKRSEPSPSANVGAEPAVNKQPVADDRDNDDVNVEDEDDAETEFEHFQDDEEFEGFDNEKQPLKPKPPAPEIKITKVPLHLRTNWDSFYIEMLMLAGLFVYFLNFVVGKTKNQRLADSWFQHHKPLLQQNFSLVGDDGKATNSDSVGLQKESESLYTLWCSGRVSCEGMLVELRFLKRQDLVNVMANLVRPTPDQIVIRINMNPDDMDTFVFAVASKRSAIRLSKDMADIVSFCPEKKNAERYGLPANFTIMNEIGEVASSILDNKIIAVLNKYQDMVDYLHFSDQYSGLKSQDDSQTTKPPDVKKVLLFGFNVPGAGRSSTDSMEAMKPLLQLVLYCIDKIRRFRLGKEAKAKADRTRLKVAEALLKTTHQQRVEAAQQRKEERRRAEKERIMAEADPERQRKWEEREHRRELKKRAPKMKQLKVKAI